MKLIFVILMCSSICSVAQNSVRWNQFTTNNNATVLNLVTNIASSVSGPSSGILNTIIQTNITAGSSNYFGAGTNVFAGAIAGNGSGLTNLPSTGGGGGGTNSAPIALTYSGTYSTNVAISCTTPLGCVTNAPLHFRLSCTTNFWIDTPTGMSDGQRIIIEFVQDATGTRLCNGLTPATFAFGTDITGLTLSTTANKRDFATFVYSTSGTNMFYCVGFTRGY